MVSRMPRRRLLGLLLLGFLAYRGVASLWVLAADRTGLAALGRLAMPPEERLRETLVIEAPDGRLTDRYLRQLLLLRQHCGTRDHVLYLHEFRGDYSVIRQFTRIRLLMYPCLVQPVAAVPDPVAPPSSPIRNAKLWLLDCRSEPAPLPSVFTRVAHTDGATLYVAVFGR